MPKVSRVLAEFSGSGEILREMRGETEIPFLWKRRCSTLVIRLSSVSCERRVTTIRIASGLAMILSLYLPLRVKCRDPQPGKRAPSCPVRLTFVAGLQGRAAPRDSRICAREECSRELPPSPHPMSRDPDKRRLVSKHPACHKSILVRLVGVLNVRCRAVWLESLDE